MPARHATRLLQERSAKQRWRPEDWMAGANHRCLTDVQRKKIARCPNKRLRQPRNHGTRLQCSPVTLCPPDSMREALIVIGLMVLDGGPAQRAYRRPAQSRCRHLSGRQFLPAVFPHRPASSADSSACCSGFSCLGSNCSPASAGCACRSTTACARCPIPNPMFFPNATEAAVGHGGSRLRTRLGLRLGMGRHAPVFPPLLAPGGTRRRRRLPVRTKRRRLRLHLDHLASTTTATSGAPPISRLPPPSAARPTCAGTTCPAAGIVSTRSCAITASISAAPTSRPASCACPTRRKSSESIEREMRSQVRTQPRHRHHPPHRRRPFPVFQTRPVLPLGPVHQGHGPVLLGRAAQALNTPAATSPPTATPSAIRYQPKSDSPWLCR